MPPVNQADEKKARIAAAVAKAKAKKAAQNTEVEPEDASLKGASTHVVSSDSQAPDTSRAEPAQEQQRDEKDEKKARIAAAIAKAKVKKAAADKEKESQ